MQKRILMITLVLLSVPYSGHADQNLVELVKKVRPSVVLIETFDRFRTPVQQGSGFFINNKGDLVTNKHIIEGAYSATVKLISGEEYSVKGVSAIDVERDVVRLHVKINGKSTPYLKPVNVLPLVGEDIVVVGNPLGLESTVSKGIVSAIRKVPTMGNILQISAPISQGSSGSPVLNMKGQVVGIASFVLEEGQALNFAIPSEAFLSLKGKGKLTRLSELSLLFQSASKKSTSFPDIKAVNNPCLKFLPTDWWLVGNFNPKAYFALIESLAEDNPLPAMAMNQYMEMIQGMIGIDPRKEIQYVTFFMSGNPETSLQGLVIVKGTFQNYITEMRLTPGLGADMQRKVYKGISLFENGDIGYCFPETSTLLLGSPAILRHSIDVTGKRITSLPDTLHGILSRTNGASIVWLAANTDIILEMEEIKALRKGYPEFLGNISAAKCASLFFESVQDGFLARVLAHVPERSGSQKLYRYLSEKKRNFLDVEGANVFFNSFLVMSDVHIDGYYVRWDTHLTVDALFQLWNTKFIRENSEDLSITNSEEPPPPPPTEDELAQESLSKQCLALYIETLWKTGPNDGLPLPPPPGYEWLIKDANIYSDISDMTGVRAERIPSIGERKSESKKLIDSANLGKVKKCANCYTHIGTLEQSYVFNNHTVCAECYRKLQNQAKRIGPTPRDYFKNHNTGEVYIIEINKQDIIVGSYGPVSEDLRPLYKYELTTDKIAKLQAIIKNKLIRLETEEKRKLAGSIHIDFWKHRDTGEIYLIEMSWQNIVFSGYGPIIGKPEALKTYKLTTDKNAELQQYRDNDKLIWLSSKANQ